MRDKENNKYNYESNTKYIISFFCVFIISTVYQICNKSSDNTSSITSTKVDVKTVGGCPF